MSYRTGNVAVAQGSKVVTGTGTLWSIAVTPGDEFVICDANLLPIGPRYEVASVDSNTKLTLVQTYQGTTASGLPYAVLNIVGNMTVPSFAQRLSKHYADFQALIDQPNETPTPASIPVADSSGKIAAGWLPDASATVKGAVELATTAEAQAGTDATRALTPATSGSRTTFAVTSTDDATSTTSASLKTAGGLAVAKSAWVGGDLHFGFSSTSHSFGVTIPSGSLSIDIVDLATLTLLYFSGRIGVFSSENGVTNTLYREYIISKNIDGWNLTPIDGTTIDSGGAPGQVTLSLSGSILTATRTSSSGACFVRVAINRVA